MADTVETRGTAVGRVSGSGRLVVALVGGLFWLWLLARWAYHNTLLDRICTALGLPDLIRSEYGVRRREPWLPAEPFQSAADSIGSVPPGFVFDRIAGVFELAAFATTAGPELAAGAFITVYMTVLGMLFGLVIAVPLSVARVYGGRIASTAALVYTELIRGTPLLAQLFFWYFALPLAGYFDAAGFVGRNGIPRAAVMVAVVAFTINSSAYQSEYIRTALESVDEGQLAAARAVGLSKGQAIRHVILPQGLRYAIPGWTNEFIYLVKYSSLAAFITVPELFRQARNIASDTFRYQEIYIIVGVFYLLLVLTIALAMGLLERTVALPGVGQPADQN
ncbi:ABC transporter permease subunit [Halovenus sp. WSH3]|uniref:ABC transporter permease subunit n=1 Tax=Halovenus carboxidivorans TaxID=2692199 RepID=A0A6B0T4E2_9EURY|nr:amino acid ABC transporter permease [Halovenus carboxidivorans]MXR50162.1 ABC transporter permease subunit [Halovenus carboxidivorans]